MQKIIVVMVVLVLGSATWRYRNHIAELTKPDHVPKPIVFDNGTVRQYESASQAKGQASVQALPVGALRKCVRGNETSYTDVSCPPGFKEKPVDNSRVSVVSGGETAKQATTPALSNPRKTLRDALDLSDDEHLRDKAIDRAVSGASK